MSSDIASLHRMPSPTKRHPTMGVFSWKGEPLCPTLELPWRDNQQQISCIPDGEYLCKRTEGRRLFSGAVIPVTFEVTDVPGRSGILFHSGNIDHHSRGCILVGSSFTIMGMQPALSESRKAFERFIAVLGNLESFTLVVGPLWGKETE